MQSYQGFYNTISNPVDSTNGMLFAPTQMVQITGVSITNQRAVGVQFWFKGSFGNNAKFVSISSDLSNKKFYFMQLTNRIYLRTDYGSANVFFGSIVSALDQNIWTYFGMSVSWVANNNMFMMWGYIVTLEINVDAKYEIKNK